MESRTHVKAHKWLIAFTVALLAAIAGCLGLVACESNTKGTLEVTKAFQSSYDDNTYGVGDPLITDGAEVTFRPNKGDPETVAITSDMVSGFTSQTVGSRTMTVTYNGATAEVNYTVIATNAATDFTYHFERPDSMTEVTDPDIMNRDDNRAVITAFIAANSEEVVVPSYINGFPVFTIAQNAFYGCAAKKITLPNTVRIIDSSAFGYCTELEEINFPNKLVIIGANAFSNTALKSLNLPASLVRIGSRAFSHNDNLTDVTVPSTVRQLGDGVLASCENLTSVSLPFPGTHVLDPQNAAYLLTSDGKMSSLPSSLTSIAYTGKMKVAASGLFKDARHVSNISLPSTVVDAETDAFTGSRWLNTQSGVVTVGGGVVVAYKGVSSSVTIPASAVAIGDEAFMNKMITNVKFSQTLETIGAKAFYGCSNLTNAALPEQLKEIRASAFENSGLTTLNTPTSLKTIGNRAFYNTKITSFVAPASLREIGSSAFENCPIESLRFTEGLLSIGSRAFGGTKITDVIFPDSLDQMGSNIFANCKLTSIITPFIGATLYDAAPLSYFFTSSPMNNATVPNTLISVTVTQAQTLAPYVFANITNRVDSEGKVLDYSPSDRNTHLSVTLNKTVEIPAYAFYNSFISTFYAPEVATIGNFAFSASTIGSASLASITSLGTNVFADCENINTVTFGSSLSIIPDYTFSGSSIISIEGISNITTIGTSAFENTPYVSTVYAPSVTSIGALAFSGSGILEYEFDSVNSIGDYAFSNTRITSATLPDTLEKVGCGIFSGTAFTSLTTPFIGKDKDTPNCLGYMFSSTSYGINNSNVPTTLTKVEVTTATRIAEYAFENITSARTNPSNGQALTFNKDNASTFLTVSLNSVTTVPFRAFSSSLVGKVTLSEILDSIESDAFNGSYITSIAIPKSTTDIGVQAFMNCTQLTEVTFEELGESDYPNAGLNFGASAFRNTALKTVELPAHASSLSDYMFYECRDLIHVKSNAKTLVTYSDVVSNATITNNTVDYLTTLTYEDDFLHYGSPSGFTYTGKNSDIDDDGMLFDGNTALRYLGSATTYTVGSNVSGFRQFTFAKTTLTDITFSDSVSTFFEGMFTATPLKSVTFANVPQTSSYNSMRMYQLYGFKNATDLVNAYVELETVEFVGGTEYTLVPSDFFSGLVNLKTATISENYEITSNMFVHCASLTSITLPYANNYAGLRYYLGSSYTYGSANPTTITVLGTATNSTFRMSEFWASNFDITLGANITEVYNLSFLAYTRRLTIRNTSAVLSVTSSASPSITFSLSIRVPSALVSSYKSANYWSNYSSYIVSA